MSDDGTAAARGSLETSIPLRTLVCLHKTRITNHDPVLHYERVAMYSHGNAGNTHQPQCATTHAQRQHHRLPAAHSSQKTKKTCSNLPPHLLNVSITTLAHRNVHKHQSAMPPAAQTTIPLSVTYLIPLHPAQNFTAAEPQNCSFVERITGQCVFPLSRSLVLLN